MSASSDAEASCGSPERPAVDQGVPTHGCYQVCTYELWRCPSKSHAGCVLQRTHGKPDWKRPCCRGSPLAASRPRFAVVGRIRAQQLLDFVLESWLQHEWLPKNNTDRQPKKHAKNEHSWMNIFGDSPSRGSHFLPTISSPNKWNWLS